MTQKEKQLYKELAPMLVNPERFGRIALSELPVEFEQLPLTYRQAAGYVEAEA